MGGTAGLMPQQVQTSMMKGGLDLITPPIVMPPGKAISAVNYEPDIAGYTSIGGYERFDGRVRPSDSTDATVIALRRGAIREVPGTGPVRGTWVFDGYLFAFRDQSDGFAGMFRSSLAGWERMTFGSMLEFGEGIAPFVEGDFVTGTTSSAVATVDRVVTRAGFYDADAPTASGYLVVSNISGAFAAGEQITSTTGGDATGQTLKQITINAGGRYDFITHNFYGAAMRPRMYFVNAVDTGFEWDGETLAPIQTGITGGSVATSSVFLMSPPSVAPNDTDSPIFSPALTDPVVPESPIAMSGLFDTPSFIAQYKNHLFLGYTSGTLLFSSLGEPLRFDISGGAGEISFGQQIVGLLEAAKTSLVIFAQNRVEYLTGTDTTTFMMNPLTDASGAQPYSIQMMDEPMFLDDGGVRRLSATSAFGDWRMGALTAPVETLIRQKRDLGINVVASLRIKGKDQFRLFWDDSSGITVYIGRKEPETMPFKLNFQVYCTCSGELEQGRGERLFAGGMDGVVYEMNRGTSYDGSDISSYIRLPFTSANSPSQNTRWMKVTFELMTPDPIVLGVAFDVDYGKGLGGAVTQVSVDPGSPSLATVSADDSWDSSSDWNNFAGSWDGAAFNAFNWMPVEARLEHHLQGIGPNIAATLVHSSAVARQHTISSQTYNFSRRGLRR